MGPYRVLVFEGGDILVCPGTIPRTLGPNGHGIIRVLGDILGQYRGLWDPTDMGPYRVLVFEGGDILVCPGTMQRTLGPNRHGIIRVLGDILGQYRGLWYPTDMGPCRVLVFEGGDILGQYRGLEDFGTPRTWDHTVSLYLKEVISSYVLGQYRGLWDPTDMGSYVSLEISWDNTEDFGTPRTWDHTVSLYLKVGIFWYVLGQCKALWDPTDMGSSVSLEISWDNTEDFGTPRTWDHAVSLYLKVGISWDNTEDLRTLGPHGRGTIPCPCI